MRKALHRLGFRFRLHAAKLPGRPDIVLPKYRAVVFVHGCFWHGHDCRHGSYAAKRNAAWWAEKIAANRARDARKQHALKEAGWAVFVVWECNVAGGRAIGPLVRALRGIVAEPAEHQVAQPRTRER